MKKLNIKQTRQNLLNKKITCQKLVEGYLDNITKQDGRIHAFLEVFEKEALAEAKKVDEKIKKGESMRALDGITMALKDNLLYEGHLASSGSKILENFVSPYTATAVKKIKDAGAIIIGRTNMDEFAMGSSTENSAYGITRNPYDLERVPGGSSGGSAAAVAAGMCAAALGSDTAGSIRQPAAFCNLVGLKPTYGAVSRYGLMAMASSLDQIGPLTNNVEDAKVLFEILKGRDEKDATSKNFKDSKEKVLKNLTIGLPKEYFAKGLDAKVENNILKKVELLKAEGAKIKEVTLPNSEYALASYYLIMPAEVSSNLARFDGIRYGHSAEAVKDLFEFYARSRAEGFGSETKRRIIIGTYVLSAGYQEAYYHKAQKVKALITQEYQEIFKQVDVLLTPTTPTPAFKIGAKFNDPLTMYLSDIYTVSANIAGLCGISLPAGLTQEFLPIGLQLLGKAFDEETILKAAYQYQEATDWHHKHPF